MKRVLSLVLAAALFACTALPAAALETPVDVLPAASETPAETPAPAAEEAPAETPAPAAEEPAPIAEPAPSAEPEEPPARVLVPADCLPEPQDTADGLEPLQITEIDSSLLSPLPAEENGEGFIALPSYARKDVTTTGVNYNYLNETQRKLYQAYMQAAYECIPYAGQSRVPGVAVGGLTVFDIAEDDFDIAAMALRFDRPDIFWTGSGFSIGYSGYSVYAVFGVDRTFPTPESVYAAQDAYEDGVNALLNSVPYSADKAVMALRLHDALAAHVRYDESTGNQHNAYGAFAEGRVVCEGYVKAYTELLRRCGIESTAVTNDTVKHAWSLVHLDNGNGDPNDDWYETDVTWDDADDFYYGTVCTWELYNLTSERMYATQHITKGRHFQRDDRHHNPLLPIATGTTFDYARSRQLEKTDTGIPQGIRDFVTRLYEVCLGRTPDEAGLQSWGRVLATGTNTGSEAAYGFIFSDEFKNKNYCNSCYIDHLYSAFMGREPDAEGHAAWIRVLEEEGQSREHVFNGFVGSNEFKAICAQYGIDPGTGTAEPEGVGTVRRGTCAGCGASDGVEDFVVRLYRVCLDRGPDENAQAWMENLRMHKDTGRTAAEGFIFSDEFKARGFDNETFVQYLYRAFFDRVPKDGEEGIWLTKLNNGGSREDVVPGFTGSDEFAVLCRRYGILAQ